ncbi:hypothetical protein SAMN04488024_10883 [Pedobacter soli]|uniref:Uncharacterized protein n=1 Tax=Pedobacter soli TaxID=390242 RepID=A0A1G6XXQ5_9SPHI|nr:hypothetical protein SAMN04488024_10883 [Pedobacter soli]
MKKFCSSFSRHKDYFQNVKVRGDTNPGELVFPQITLISAEIGSYH